MLELVHGQLLSTLAALLGAVLLVLFGRRSNRALQAVAVTTPLVVGLTTWHATDAAALALTTRPVDQRAAGLAAALDLGVGSPLPHLLLAPLWAVGLLLCAWGPRAAWSRLDLLRLGLVLAVPATRSVWVVQPRSFAGGFPTTLIFLTIVGGLVLLARPERQQSAAIVWSGLVPLALLVEQANSLLFPLVCYTSFQPETTIRRLEDLLLAAPINNLLLVVATVLAYVPLALTRPRALVLTAPIVLVAVWLASPVEPLMLELEAYRVDRPADGSTD